MSDVAKLPKEAAHGVSIAVSCLSAQILKEACLCITLYFQHQPVLVCEVQSVLVTFREENGKKVRYLKKTGEVLPVNLPDRSKPE